MGVSPFVKQLFVASAPLLASLSVGGAVSYPTVLLHQLKRNDTEITLDFDTASWIGAIHGFAGIPSILMPTIMQWRGRKIALILACVVSITGWLLSYNAKSSSVLLASESLHGFGSNSIFAVTYLSISEMLSPAYRDSLMQLYLVLELIIMALNGILTHYLHWKTISAIMCLPMLLALVVACLWPESPYWLAFKGDFERCQKAFVWLRGNDIASETELRHLINAQKERIARDKLKGDSNILKCCFKKIMSKDFYVPAAHMCLLQFVVYGMGSLVTIIYAIELFQRVTGDIKVAFYGSFVVNGMQLFGVVGTILIGKYFRKKTILLTSICSATVSLFCASLASYFKTASFLSNDSLIPLYFFVAYFASLSFGVISVAYCIAVEVMPVMHRGVGGVLYATNTCVFHTVALKLAPYLFALINLHGTFLIFALNGLICGLLIYKYVPDTQDKTLQQIENYYKHGRFDHESSSRSEDTAERMLSIS